MHRTSSSRTLHQSVAGSMDEEPFLRSSTAARCRRRPASFRSCLPLLAVTLFGLLLLVALFIVLLNKRPPLALVVSSSTAAVHAVAKGADHRVELYSYYDNRQQLFRYWEDFSEHSNLMVLDDAKLISRDKIVPIGTAHSEGWLHRGIWIAVLRRQRRPIRNNQQLQQIHEVLLLRRAPTLKTCPNALGLCGEHSDPGETWVDTGRRALREELQIVIDEDDFITETTQGIGSSTTTATAQDTGSSRIVNLVSGTSLLVQTQYKEMQRRELQATGLLAVVLTQEQADRIQPDDEVSDIKWVPIEQLQVLHYCNEEITDLAKLVGRRLQELGYT